MKKRYQKPEVSFEDFELSTNIAYSCAVKVEGPTNGSCGLTIPGVPGVVFLSAVIGCTRSGSDGEYSYCYHVPTEAQKLFNS